MYNSSSKTAPLSIYSVFEGAANNLPDPPAHKAACEILAVCREAREGDVVVALISGGGSALP